MNYIPDELDFSVKRRMTELLETPYAGSKAFKHNHPRQNMFLIVMEQ
jgi:hypothetical protein